MVDNNIIPLGSGGWMPSKSRQTMCYALPTTSHLLFFDLGTGVSRLLSKAGQKLLQNHEKVIILISHYHLDHIVGLQYLPKFLSNKKITIGAPGKSLYNTSAEQILSKICSPPLFSMRLADFPMELNIIDLEPGTFSIDDVLIRAKLLKHSSPTLGYSTTDVSYISDTACSPEQYMDICKDSSILLHESMFDFNGFQEMRYERESDHSHANQVAELAKAANVQKLVLTHLNPSYSKNRLSRMLEDARSIFPNTVLSEDLTPIKIRD